MANPIVVPCPANDWTKVATNVTTGIVHIIKTDPDAYFQTYRLTGQSAPSNDADAVPFTTPLQISASAAIDVYIKPVNKSGSVRVDL